MLKLLLIFLLLLSGCSTVEAPKARTVVPNVDNSGRVFTLPPVVIPSTTYTPPVTTPAKTVIPIPSQTVVTPQPPPPPNTPTIYQTFTPPPPKITPTPTETPVPTTPVVPTVQGTSFTIPTGTNYYGQALVMSSTVVDLDRTFGTVYITDVKEPSVPFHQENTGATWYVGVYYSNRELYRIDGNCEMTPAIDFRYLLTFAGEITIRVGHVNSLRPKAYNIRVTPVGWYFKEKSY